MNRGALIAGLTLAAGAALSPVPAGAQQVQVVGAYEEANPNHVQVDPHSEAWELYQDEVGQEGCWADYVTTYRGVWTNREDPGKGWLVISSNAYPGTYYRWSPYQGACGHDL